MIKGLSIIHLVVKNKKGGERGLKRGFGINDVYAIFDKSRQLTSLRSADVFPVVASQRSDDRKYVCASQAIKWLSLSAFSKVVSVDHNKPIIVPVGQDSFQQIGERVEFKIKS